MKSNGSIAHRLHEMPVELCAAPTKRFPAVFLASHAQKDAVRPGPLVRHYVSAEGEDVVVVLSIRCPHANFQTSSVVSALH